MIYAANHTQGYSLQGLSAGILRGGYLFNWISFKRKVIKSDGVGGKVVRENDAGFLPEQPDVGVAIFTAETGVLQHSTFFHDL